MLLPQVPTDHKYEAIRILANCATVDTENRVHLLKDRYFALLNDNSLIAPAQVALETTTILRTIPELESQILPYFLNIDSSPHDPQRKALIIANFIDSIIDFYPIAKNRDLLWKFVNDHQNEPSPKARINAKRFFNTFPPR